MEAKNPAVKPKIHWMLIKIAYGCEYVLLGCSVKSIHAKKWKITQEKGITHVLWEDVTPCIVKDNVPKLECFKDLDISKETHLEFVSTLPVPALTFNLNDIFEGMEVNIHEKFDL